MLEEAFALLVNFFFFLYVVGETEPYFLFAKKSGTLWNENCNNEYK